MEATPPMSGGETPQSWDRMGPEQLKLYARELADLYRKEQELRQEIEVKNTQLERRIRELMALNNMFQQHLDLRMRTEDAYRQLVDGLRNMVEKAEAHLKLDQGQEPLARDKQ